MYKNKEDAKKNSKTHYEKNKATYAKRNKEAKQRGKEIIKKHKDVPCMDCGIKYPYYVMDFDHVRGNKLFNVGKGAAAGNNVLLKEIEKCEVVCANCHRERTFRRVDRVGIVPDC